MASDCVVHHRKYLSQFHANVNELRRQNEFHVSILGKLPKRCCSCQNRIGESSFTVDHLRALCREMDLAMTKAALVAGENPFEAPSPVKTIHHVALKLPPLPFVRQRVYKIGRFVGRNGKNIRALERRLNISIQMFDPKSSKKLQVLSREIKSTMTHDDVDDLLVFFTVNNANENIRRIDQAIRTAWDAIVMLLSDKKRTRIIGADASGIYAPAAVEGDSRWRPKRRIPKSRLNARERQNNEQEQVAPQPWVKPIPMPKEVTKSSRRR